MEGHWTKPMSWKRVLVDICTQRDYLEPNGLLRVLNRDELEHNLRRVFAWVMDYRIPVFSSAEAHRPSEPPGESPLHCVDGTPGQEKLAYTLLSNRLTVHNDNYLSLPPNLREYYQQLIFLKRGKDVLSNPKADRFLTQLEADQFFLVGVGLDRAIKTLALGLLARQRRVAVVTDACGYWSSADADLATRQLAAKGVQLLTTDELLALLPKPAATPHRRRRRVRSGLRHRHQLRQAAPERTEPSRQVRSS